MSSTTTKTSTRRKSASAPKPSRARASVRFPVKRILVPTDFSDMSRQAIRYAASLADALKAQVSLIHVEPSAWPIDVDAAPLIIKRENYRQAAHALLDQYAAKAVPKERQGKAIVTTGTPHNEIVHQARASKADLIVTATHGYTQLKHLLLGSTAEQIVRHAHCPALTVKSKPGGSRGKQVAKIRKILVATDFSTAADHSLKWAAELANRLGASLSLLHVLELPSYPRYGYARIPTEDAKRKKAALEELKTWQTTLGKDQIASIPLRTGIPSQEIALEAKKSKADLVVVGTHGHGVLAHILLGSTAERVVRNSPCPVLVTRV